MAGQGQYVRNTSVHGGFNKGITIHDTNLTYLEDNVIFNNIGHGFFFEDATETGNVLRNNLSFGQRKAPSLANATISSDFTRPASYWVTNPNNHFINNVAAGSAGTGIWITAEPRATGAALATGDYEGYVPKRQPVGMIRGFTSHSNALRNFNMGWRLREGNGTQQAGHFIERYNEDGALYDYLVEDLTLYKGAGDVVPGGSRTTNITASMARWSASSTWNGTNPNQNSVVVIGPGSTVVLDRSVTVKGIIISGGELLIEDNANLKIELTSDFILVNNQGLFQAGTESNPIDTDFTLTLAGTDPNFDLQVSNNVVSAGQGSTVYAANSNKVVHIRKRNALNYAIDGKNGASDGQNVYLWSRNPNNANQQWIEISRGDGYYAYQKMGTNHCIDGGDGGARRQNVALQECDCEDENQHWKKEDVGSGFVKLVKRNAPFCIDGGNGGARRQNVQLWNANINHQNLHWLIQDIDLVSARLDNEIENDSPINIAPNPTTDYLDIDLSVFMDRSVDYFIMSVDGAKIKEGLIESNHAGTVRLDLDNINDGIYVIYLKPENRRSFAKKFIVVKNY